MQVPNVKYAVRERGREREGEREREKERERESNKFHMLGIHNLLQNSSSLNSEKKKYLVKSK